MAVVEPDPTVGAVQRAPAFEGSIPSAPVAESPRPPVPGGEAPLPAGLPAPQSAASEVAPPPAATKTQDPRPVAPQPGPPVATELRTAPQDTAVQPSAPVRVEAATAQPAGQPASTASLADSGVLVQRAPAEQVAPAEMVAGAPAPAQPLGVVPPGEQVTPGPAGTAEAQLARSPGTPSAPAIGLGVEAGPSPAEALAATGARQRPGSLAAAQAPGDLRVTRPWSLGQVEARADRAAATAAPQVQRQVVTGTVGHGPSSEEPDSVRAAPAAAPSRQVAPVDGVSGLAQRRAAGEPAVAPQSHVRADMPLAAKQPPAHRLAVQRKPVDGSTSEAESAPDLPGDDAEAPATGVRIGAHRQANSTTTGTVVSTRSLPTGPVDLEDNVRAKPDLDALARQILPLVRRLLMVERDRYSQY